MALQLYNTLTRTVEPFTTVKKGIVRMYACGPTVYDFAHIGNFRAFVAVDLLRRTLKREGFQVEHVMNLTDVDDKTIKGSKKAHQPLLAFTAHYSDEFFKDLSTLNIERPEHITKATAFIPQMIKMVQELIKKDHAYVKDGSVYFRIESFPAYGALAGISLEGLKQNADGRLDEDEAGDKEDPRDFALWKVHAPEDGDVFWESPWGKGRPGWHIECSVMSSELLGLPLDLHAGGIDLKFPHHVNEIAQSEAASGKRFANHWFHNEHLLIEGEKMSKSLGNFYTLRDILAKGHDGRTVRYLLLSTHYRQKLNFTMDGLEGAKKTLERIDEFILRTQDAKGKEEDIHDAIEEAKARFDRSLEDDLNISGALASLHDLMREANKRELSPAGAKEVLEAFYSFDEVLGLGLREVKRDELDSEIESLVQEREAARKRKDFATSDRIRDTLKAKGIILSDTPNGVTWKKA